MGSGRDGGACSDVGIIGDSGKSSISLTPPTLVSGLRVGFFTSIDESEELEFSIDGKDVNAEMEESEGEEASDPDVTSSI